MTRRALIAGAGTAGRSLAASIIAAGETVVGFLDDAQTGPDVLGTLAQVDEVARAQRIDQVYFAIPSARAEQLRAFLHHITSTELEVAIIPRTYDIIAKDTVDIADLTDVDVLDLVGREPVKHDLMAAQAFIEGKTVLITGAAGSIGSRLARHVARFNAARVVCVDRWENGMFYLGQQLAEATNVELCLADIADEARLHQVLSQVRPDVVFHAAAFKHVPLMQDNPLEAINNNVWGTLNVMRQAVDHGVKNIVYVSTDKAVNPVNVMGATKRLGEMIMESLSDRAPDTVFTGVRFGNVIESNGSVMQTFRAQIAAGGPVTVTHADVTRFFMTIDEASQLIIQSASLGRTREIFVLDMGEPVKILDLAQSLIRATKPGIQIEFTGLRPGEKMYEELSYEPDRVARTTSEKIFIVKDELDYDRTSFLGDLEGVLKRSRAYELSPAEGVAFLRSFGFAIQ